MYTTTTPASSNQKFSKSKTNTSLNRKEIPIKTITPNHIISSLIKHIKKYSNSHKLRLLTLTPQEQPCVLITILLINIAITQSNPELRKFNQMSREFVM